MATNEETYAAGTDTRPPMLVEDDYESWKIRIQRYIRGKQNGKLIWKSIQNGPTPHPMITDPPPTGSTVVPAPRKKLDSEFNEEENKLEMADTQAEIILSQGLPRHIFNILNQTSTAKEIWDNVELLMQGSGRTLQQRKEDLFDEYERFRAIGNESIHDYFVRFHKLVNDMKITHPTHQMNTKFVNNLPAYWGKYVTNVKQNMDISTTSYVQIYTHLKAYEPHAKKTLKKQEQSASIVDPLAYVAHTTSAPALPSPSTPCSQPTAQSSNDALMATMTQIANLLSGFQKQFPPTNNQLRTSSNSKTHATVHDGQIVTEPIQRKAPGNVGNTGARGKKVICYNCRAKKKRDVTLDAKLEAFLDEFGNATTIKSMRYTLDDNQIFDNVNDQSSHEMHQKNILDFPDAENRLMKIRFHRISLVIQRNKRNAELEQENVLLKSALSVKDKSITLLQSEKEKILSEKKELADSYLDEIVCLKNANKVARDMLQRFNMPTQTIPMLSKKPIKATDDLHKDILGLSQAQSREVKEYEQIFDDLDAEYERCVLDNKNLTIEKKNLLIKNDCLIAECLEKDICSIVLTSDIVVRLCEDLRSACDREHTKVLELAAEVLKQQKMVIESEKRNSHLQKTHIDLQLKFQTITSAKTLLVPPMQFFELNNSTERTKPATDSHHLCQRATLGTIRILPIKCEREESTYHNRISTIKLPILKKGEYDIWAMKMEHYLAHTDYPIWEVIQNGNGPVSVTTDTSGQLKILPPKIAEEIVARERERKARTTLLMAIPEDHLAKFHKMTNAKEMWNAIKSRFGGNDESKKMQK
ncbi:hypothetical protein Tco_0740534 [Tanacetum coccineum]